MPDSVPSPIDQALWAGATWPLGPSVDEDAGHTSFTIHAPAATRVRLEFFGAAVGQASLAQVDMAACTDGCWRARVAGAGHGSFYGFRVWGPNWPSVPGWGPGNSAEGFIDDLDANGNRFNPNKLLFDPYAPEISHTMISEEIFADGYDDGMFGTGGDEYFGRPRREFDTALWAPKGIVVVDHTETGERPRVAPQDAAIYEAHVKNLTAHPSASRLEDLQDDVQLALLPRDCGRRASLSPLWSNVPQECRGTYAGAAMMAPYLRALGFTTLELLPVHETNTSPIAHELGRGNHWGYMTLSFFAPNRAYASDRSPGGPTREFKQMVKALHDAGLEVYLDVVYNHSAEGGNWGNRETTGFVSMGGFAASDYYLLTADHRLVDGATGCSNQLNASRTVVRQLVLDSLAHWADDMGVDGFRFDLAPVLGRRPDRADREDWGRQRQFFDDHPLLVAIERLAAERDIEVIAEAWDLWGYEVGNFPTGWGEWNGRYRDTLRRYLRGDGNVGSFADQVNGSYADFADQGGPQRSINFVTAHDGFTMTDLVSYNQKNNLEPFPFGPSDGGADDNLSWDSGGDAALRRQRIRNLWVVLFVSRGVPMVVAGDEYGRTQNGNNNPWNLDTVGLWNNWAMAAAAAPTAVPVDPDHPEWSYHDNLGTADSPACTNPVLGLAAHMARLRQSHPALRQCRYGNDQLDDDDVSYLFTRPDGASPQEGDRAVRIHVDGSGVGDVDLLVLVNMGHESARFSVPAAAPEHDWRCVVDTAAWAEPQGCCWAETDGTVVEGDYEVHPWGVAVLVEVGTVDALVEKDDAKDEAEQEGEQSPRRGLGTRMRSALKHMRRG